MSQTFECGDTGALVAYLYDECEPGVRAVIDEHLARCRTCASEVNGLGWTRQQLAAWAPPATALGFQIESPSAVVAPMPVKVAWWRAPLPAWAQAAAALLIFAAGLAVGTARQPASAPQSAAAPAPAVTAAPVVAQVSQTDLSQLEQRLKVEMARMRAPVTTAATTARADGDEIMRQVRALLEESEERQRRDFTLRSVEMARDIEAQRRVDLASVRETVGQLQGVTGAEIRQQREAIERINNYFIRVSQQGR
jgi:hypothetical protein